MKTPEFILLRQHLRRGGYLNAIYLINQSFKSPTLYTLYHRHHRLAYLLLRSDLFNECRYKYNYHRTCGPNRPLP